VEDPQPIDTTELPQVKRHRGGYRRAAIALAVGLAAALVVVALADLNLSRVGHVLITATPGWLVLALALMAASLVLRSISWHQTLRAALPDASIAPMWVTRATMIGVMTSALFPGRIGEPSRVIVLTRHLQGPNRRLLPVVAGTVFSQTLINLVALAILLAVTFTSLPLPQGNVTGIVTALAVPLLVCALVIAGPRLLALARRSRSERLARAAGAASRALNLARQGLVVFARPRYGATAVASQLLAWALQWLACYAVLLALGLQSHGGLVAAAAILLAVNLSAVLPATPSNVGVFQAACLVVLAAYGVGAGAALAYGILLQAVEVLTALALGVPALLGEGLRWSDVRTGTAPVPVTVSGEESAGEGSQ
jgi:phosphatidyl-myo-inositol alpha-mannosyltransferase